MVNICFVLLLVNDLSGELKEVFVGYFGGEMFISVL